jgi:hypothetical protein
MIDYNNRVFKPVSTSDNGEVDSETLFVYKQKEGVVTCEYRGANIRYGHLLAIVSASGQLNMTYHQVNIKNEIVTGLCKSVPELLPNGKIRLKEEWQWTCRDYSKGYSVLEEM